MGKRAEPWTEEHQGLGLTHWGDPPPTVLLVHGYGYTSQVWGGFAAQLASDAHVVAVDWVPGSPRARFADMCAEVGKVMGVLDRVDVVVAHAEGAAAAVDLAVQGFARGLVLFDPGADKWPPEREVDLSRPVPADWGDPLVEEAFAAMGELAAGIDSGDERLIDSGHEHLIDASSRAFAQHVADEEDRALIRPIMERHFNSTRRQPVLDGSEPYWIDRLRDVRVPVLTAPENSLAETLAARAPRGEWVPIECDIPFVWMENRSRAIQMVKSLFPDTASGSRIEKTGGG